VSLVPFHPALAGHPSNRFAGPAVDERLAILLGQAVCPSVKSLIGELSAFGAGVPQRSTKLLTTAMIEFAPDSIRNELAAVLLSPVDVSDEFQRQGYSHTFDAGHFILLV
jgi:hypothetical protein